MAFGNKEEKKSAPAANENIVVGEVYKEKNGDAEVIPYFVDVAAASVQFAGVGRSNEERSSTSDFLANYEHVGSVSSRAEKQVSNEDALKDKEKVRKDDERAVAEDRTAARRKTGV